MLALAAVLVASNAFAAWNGSPPPAQGVPAQAAPAPSAASDLGDIRFPTSGAPAARADFARGVLLLHSFEYADAATAFRAAQRLDPGFAMAYWGEAMTYDHPLWHQQDRAAAVAVLARLAPTAVARRAKAPTAREQGFLAAVETLYGESGGRTGGEAGVDDKPARDRRYAAAMERLHAADPGDEEAAAFYALALLGTCEAGRDIPTYMRAAAVAEEVFARHPRHPGAVHYLIHAYDDPVHAPLGLRAARVYAGLAPAASHALHMPSHIFLALGMWDEVAASNEASAAAAEARRLRLHLPADERGYHALLWLEYAYLQQGRRREARALLDSMAADAAASGSPRTREHLARMQAAFLVDGPAAARGPLDSLPGLDGLDEDVATEALFAHGYAAWRAGDGAAAGKALAAIRAKLNVSTAPSPTEPVPAAPVAHPPAWSSAQVMEAELAALLRFAAAPAEAVTAIERAADAEDAATYEFGPPVVAKPAHELAGELLLRLGRTAAARRHFEQALAPAPGRSLALRGLAQSAARPGNSGAVPGASAGLAADAEIASAAIAHLARNHQRADPDVLAEDKAALAATAAFLPGFPVASTAAAAILAGFPAATTAAPANPAGRVLSAAVAVPRPGTAGAKAGAPLSAGSAAACGH
jgi:tetratricopeptide (TPR) repeat protein